MSFEIIKTKSIGFCFGVSRAVSALYEAIQTESRPIYTFGPIIHNDTINEDLSARGVRVTENPEEIERGAIVFIRAHGVSAEVYDRIAARQVEIRDMTCPRVKRIHKIVSECDRVIIFGDEMHPEVRGIVGNAKGEYRLATSEGDFEKILTEISPDFPYTVVEQTTSKAFVFDRLRNAAEGYPNVTIEDTICTATYERQREVDVLSRQVDAMIIIGGRDSSNTKKLYEIASKNCVSFLIGDASQLPKDLHKYKKIGLSAGASTPSGTIEEVINNMENENTAIVTDEAFDFAAELDASMKIIRKGQKVTGTVMAINGNDVQIDLGANYTGIIAADEFATDETPVALGDTVEAFVEKTNDVEGTALLSKRKIDEEKGYEKIQELQQSGEVVTGKVQQVVKGGLVVSLNKVRVFIPASHASLNKNDDLNELAGKEVQFRIIEVELKGRNSRVIGSIRNVLREEKNAKAKELWDSIEVGKKYNGVVKSLTNFGAFVDIGGGDGLVHVTDLAWGRIKHPSDIVKEGDVIEVEVKSYDPETKRISLVYKKEADNPWTIFRAKYDVDDVVDVKVLKLMPYGAFVSIIDGVDGLVHISQLAHKRVEKVADVLTVGQEVQAKITAIDEENQKVSLSIKALLPEEQPAENAEEPAETTEEPAATTEE